MTFFRLPLFRAIHPAFITSDTYWPMFWVPRQKKMQCGGGGRQPIRPPPSTSSGQARFFSRLPRTPSTLFPLPLTVQAPKCRMRRRFVRSRRPSSTWAVGHSIAKSLSCTHFRGRVEGKRKGSEEGAGGARGKLFACPELVEGGLIWFPLAPPALHLNFVFQRAPLGQRIGTVSRRLVNPLTPQSVPPHESSSTFPSKIVSTYTTPKPTHTHTPPSTAPHTPTPAQTAPRNTLRTR